MYKTRCVRVVVVRNDDKSWYDLWSPWISKVEVSHVKLIEWVSKKLEDKFMYWIFQFWPFHACINSLRDVKCVLRSLILLTSLQSMLNFVQWHRPQERGYANSLQMDVLATTRLLRGKLKQLLNLQFN